ncbi:MAG: chain-length determining protein [Methylococcaceae bacterium]|nr:chain-length determining protein [Methylococcaceae bacterium]
MKATTQQNPLIVSLKRHPIFACAIVASILAVIYWGLIASDRYISDAHVMIQSTDLVGSESVDLSGLLGNTGGNNKPDQLLLRDYLLSVDMLKKLDKLLNLREHFSDPKIDIFSRMWAKDVSLEEFYEYYLSRVSVEYDDYSGVLVINVQAYNPKMAHDIATILVSEGELFMNTMARNLAKEQVDFLQSELQQITENTMEARQQMLTFQNAHGLASPQSTAENVSGIVNNLEAQLSEIQTKKSAMLSYLMPSSPNVAELNIQISAIEKQLAKEKDKLTSPNKKTLNRTIEEYQRLEMNAQFAQEIYKTALIGLEKGRFEASRTLKKMSILQEPTLPEYPLQPRRIYNMIVFIIFTLVIAGIAQLLAAIIRDHKE